MGSSTEPRQVMRGATETWHADSMGKLAEWARWLVHVWALAALMDAARAAEPYPSRHVTMVVPYSAGGPTDTVARVLADRMRPSLGQSVIVENIAGAAGTVGVARAARAAPDGYTMIVGDLSSHVINGAIYRLTHDLVQDFEPVSLLASNPPMIVAKHALPARDLRELLDYLRENPGKLLAGTAGVGSPPHVVGVYFQNSTGTRFQFVPYRGGGPAMQDLVAGHIDLMFTGASNALPHLRAGAIKAYGVAAKARLAAAPDIPTTDEAGLPAFHVSIWQGLWVPRGTTEDVIAKLNAAVVDALADSAVRKRFADLGVETAPRDQQNPEALRDHQRAEIKKWWPIIEAMNIRSQ
jgi:tripartite-type tricarboxylate transporter receptor subunit TctC